MDKTQKLVFYGWIALGWLLVGISLIARGGRGA